MEENKENGLPVGKQIAVAHSHAHIVIGGLQQIQK